MLSATKPPIGLTIIVNQIAEAVTPKDAFTNAIATQIISQQETVVDGIPAYEGLEKAGPAEIGPFLYQHIFVVNNDNIYHIEFSEKLEKGNETSLHQQQLFDQILSTFKFTDTVLGIQLTQCCSCPTMIDTSQIGKNGWVVYEQGKDYTAQRPNLCSQPNIGACAPCPPLETKSFTCPPSGWVDCMPGTSAKPECSSAAMVWYKANCPDFKGGAL